MKRIYHLCGAIVFCLILPIFLGSCAPDLNGSHIVKAVYENQKNNTAEYSNLPLLGKMIVDYNLFNEYEEESDKLALEINTLIESGVKDLKQILGKDITSIMVINKDIGILEGILLTKHYYLEENHGLFSGIYNGLFVSGYFYHSVFLGRGATNLRLGDDVGFVTLTWGTIVDNFAAFFQLFYVNQTVGTFDFAYQIENIFYWASFLITILIMLSIYLVGFTCFIGIFYPQIFEESKEE